MRTDGSRGSNWVRDVTRDYLKSNGFKIEENNGSQVIVNDNRNIRFCYNNLPSPLYMQKFNHLLKLSNQKHSEYNILYDIEAFNLQNRYLKAAGLTVQRKPFTFNVVVCKNVTG